MLTIKFKLDKEDHLAYQLYVASNSERIKKARKIRKFRVPLIYLLIALLFFLMNDLAFVMAFSVIAVLWFFFYPVYERKRYEKHYASSVEENFSKDMDNEVTVEFSGNEIHTEDEMGQSSIKIESIVEVDEIKDYFFIRLTPAMGLVLPKAKIDSLDDLEDWFSMIQEKFGIEKKVDIDWKWK